MELVTFNFEVSTGEFNSVKPEPRKQVATRPKENYCFQRKLYISLHSVVVRIVRLSRFGFFCTQTGTRCDRGIA